MFVLILLLILACGDTDKSVKPPEAIEQVQPNEQKPAPPKFKLNQVDEAGLGQLLSATSNKPRVISFWATWCTPCIVEIAMLDAVAATRDDIEIILVNVDHTSILERRVIPFIKERQLRRATLFHLSSQDPNVSLREVVPNWPDSIPVTIIKDKAGKTVSRFNTSLTREQLEAALLPAFD